MPEGGPRAHEEGPSHLGGAGGTQVGGWRGRLAVPRGGSCQLGGPGPDAPCVSAHPSPGDRQGAKERDQGSPNAAPASVSPDSMTPGKGPEPARKCCFPPARPRPVDAASVRPCSVPSVCPYCFLSPARLVLAGAAAGPAGRRCVPCCPGDASFNALRLPGPRTLAGQLAQ